MNRYFCLILSVLLLLLAGCHIAEMPSVESPDSILPASTAREETLGEITTATKPFDPEPSSSAPGTTTPETEPCETVPPEPAGFDAVVLTLTLSIEERIGQMFLARCPAKGAIEDISAYHLGGYLLFAQDFANRTPGEVRAILESYQSASAIPMLIGVDEEGGTVTRVSRYPQFRDKKFDSPRNLYESGGIELVLSTEIEKCALLSSLGIHLNLSPVCDITTDPSAFLYKRSLGLEPEKAAQVIYEMVRTMKENGIASALKHFPGYGNNADTHVGIAIDNRSLSDLESADLVPFTAGIDAGCGSIMVSHTIVTALDETLPASLSPKVVTYLRNEMGFDGVIPTDDLVMDAISDRYGAGQSAVLAVLAGVDLLCSSEYALQYEAVLQAVRNGEIPEATINEACARILTWKHEMGLIQAE